MNLFLTPDELQQLTDRKSIPGQIKWLHSAGIQFVLSAAGRPKVLRARIETMLGAERPKARERRPNLSVIGK